MAKFHLILISVFPTSHKFYQIHFRIECATYSTPRKFWELCHPWLSSVRRVTFWLCYILADIRKILWSCSFHIPHLYNFTDDTNVEMGRAFNIWLGSKCRCCRASKRIRRDSSRSTLGNWKSIRFRQVARKRRNSILRFSCALSGGSGTSSQRPNISRKRRWQGKNVIFWWEPDQANSIIRNLIIQSTEARYLCGYSNGHST